MKSVSMVRTDQEFYRLYIDRNLVGSGYTLDEVIQILKEQENEKWKME